MICQCPGEQLKTARDGLPSHKQWREKRNLLEWNARAGSTLHRPRDEDRPPGSVRRVRAGTWRGRRLRAPARKSGRPVFAPALASHLLCDLSVVTQPLCASSVKLFIYPVLLQSIGESRSRTVLGTFWVQGEPSGRGGCQCGKRCLPLSRASRETDTVGESQCQQKPRASRTGDSAHRSRNRFPSGP